MDPSFFQAVSAAWDERSGQLVAAQLAQWKLTKGQVKHAGGLNNSRRDIERWLAPIKKVVCRPRGKDQRWGKVVLVDEHRTTLVSSAVNGQQPCPTQQPGSHTGSSLRARTHTLPAAKRSKRTEAEQAAEPSQPAKGKGKGKGKPAPQPGRVRQ
ncbi:hypothetical protein HaLaN_16783 [Haematococcus lacustris]|uniref:Uncharacterized protein n=1 Tax=Haematococcus lacustris TaxID=44745 RepID=A0A699ZAY6_HAELA|nr:hypothetical protein HaLaN_16783 [Haematococcus lacustris]